MKRMFVLALLALRLVTPVCAQAQYWEDTTQRPVVCCDDRPGCQVLQTVMMGSFAHFDPEDSLNVRVFSAALPRLSAVTEADFNHFTTYFDIELSLLKELYYIALGNCFRSDLLVAPVAENIDERNARTVLELFLHPADRDSYAQMRAIRIHCGEEDVARLAKYAQVPEGFVEYLIFGKTDD